MGIHALLDFLRSRPAVLVASAFIIVIVLGLASALRPQPEARHPVLFTNTPPAAATVERKIVPGVASPPRPPPPPPTNPPLAQLRIHVELPPDTNPPPLAVYAPAGRLIQAQLVNTVDSANIDTPIIALVTQDLWHDGRLVVPVGTELHGRARVERMRERIVASGPWTLVWQNGEELNVEAIALDREFNANRSTFGITDGSAGLSGQVLRSDSSDEIKLFLATFMSGMASGFQETRPTVLGPQFASTARNAALTGASQVLNRYAEEIADTIRREGIFVRVPAGKQMYLYIVHTLDRSQARVGSLRPGHPNVSPGPTVVTNTSTP